MIEAERFNVGWMRADDAHVIALTSRQFGQ
jgi:hypothetical protein